MKLTAFRDPGVWFLIILAVCVVAPYLFGVRPKTRRDWILIGITIAFAAWLLVPQMIPVR
jgi:hypothetical protein